MSRLTLPLIAAILVGLSLWLYAPALKADFVNWDDPENFIDNTAYQGLSGEHLKWMATTSHLGHHQPLTWFSFALDHVRSGGNGLDPKRAHATSLAIHCVAIVLVFLLFLAFTRVAFPAADASKARVMGATLAALLFAVHPMRVEAVAWLSARGFLLCATFLIGSLLCYLHAVRAEQAGEKTRYQRFIVLCWVLAFVSWLAREWAIFLPLLLLLLDVYPFKRLSLRPRPTWSALRPRLLEKAPLFLFSLVGGYFGWMARSENRFLQDFEQHPITFRIMQSFQHLVFHPKKTVWPQDLAITYLEPYNYTPFEPRFFVAAGVVLGAFIVGLVLVKRAPWLLTALVAYCLIIAPVVGPGQSVMHIAADRYAYIAILPFMVVLAIGFTSVCRRVSPASSLVLMISAVMILLFGMMSRAQVHAWSSGQALWDHAISVNPDNYLALTNRGELFMRSKERDKAKFCFERSIQLNPSISHPYNNLGSVYLEIAEDAKLARDTAAQSNALQVAEDLFLEAYARTTEKVSPLHNLGLVWGEQGDFDRALKYFDEALYLAPGHTLALFNRARALGALERHEESLLAYDELIERAPGVAEYHFARGRLLQNLNQRERAIADFNRTLEINPAYRKIFEQEGLLNPKTP